MLKRALVTVAAAALVAVPAGSGQAVVPDTPRANMPEFDGKVVSLSRHGAIVYVGGKFSRVTVGGTTYARRNAAAFDMNTGRLTNWNPNVSGTVRDVLYTDEGVYLGGKFSSVRGQARGNLALVSKGKGKVKAWGPRTNRVVHTVTAYGNRLFVGGNFDRAAGRDRVRLAAFNRRTGRLTGWAPRALSGPVHDLVAVRRGVFVAGQFLKLNKSASHQRLALVTRSRGTLIPAFNPPVVARAWDIHVKGNRVYVAVGGAAGGSAMAVARRDGKKLWDRRFDGDVQAVMPMKGVLYLGGHFNLLCDRGSPQGPSGTCANYQAAARGVSLDPATGDNGSWNAGLNKPRGIIGFAKYGPAERLIVGGDFDRPNARALAIYG